MRRVARTAVVLLTLAAPIVPLVTLHAAETEVLIFLEALAPPAPGLIPESAPARFALYSDGQVFVGGTRSIAAGRADKNELKQLADAAERVRRITPPGAVTLGPSPMRYRLLLRKGSTIEYVVSGEPTGAPPAYTLLANLIMRLEAYTHPSLRPYQPSRYALRARQGALVGSCRSWSYRFPIEDALSGFRTVDATAAKGWPTGAVAASVCSGEKSFIVTLKPLLPSEQP